MIVPETSPTSCVAAEFKRYATELFANNAEELSNLYQQLQAELQLEYESKSDSYKLCDARQYKSETRIVPFVGYKLYDAAESLNVSPIYRSGHPEQLDYVVCSEPLYQSAKDMWALVWSRQITTIIVLGETNSDNWPAKEGEIREYGQVLVRLLHEIEFTANNSLTLILCLYARGSRRRRLVLLMHYQDWVEHQAPNIAQFNDFFQLVRNRLYKRQYKTPVFVYSRCGGGRSGACIAIDLLIRDLLLEPAGCIDIYETVKHLGRHRMMLVENKTQFGFLYEFMLRYIEERRKAWRKLGKM